LNKRALELLEVVKHYPSGGGEIVRAVDGVSLTVSPGEFVAMYGPSGSGKTTLLLLAAALIAPEAGSVLFDGRDVSHLSEREGARYRLRDVGFVFQSFHLMPNTSALDNATIKLTAEGLRLGDGHGRGSSVSVSTSARSTRPSACRWVSASGSPSPARS
jgi:putative ABC transport system ATP-binding protein